MLDNLEFTSPTNLGRLSGMKVTYKLVPEFPAYQIGSDGSAWTRWVRTVKGLGTGSGSAYALGDWHRLNPSVSGGYEYINAHQPGTRAKKFRIHVLVALLFKGPRPVGNVVRHWDGNTRNNRATNIRYGTPKQNARDRHRHGRYEWGEQHRFAKITAEKASKIRVLGQTLRTCEIARRENVTWKIANDIIRGRTWKRLNPSS